MHEEDDGGSGHGPRPLVSFALKGAPQAAADVVTLWARRGSLFQCEVPTARPEASTRLEKRRHDHRQAAAASPDVVATAVPPHAGLAAAVDPALLCWFFPRERGGRYLRSVVVALAPCRDGRPHLSRPWLTARAGSDRLLLEVRDLIPANQPHRWDVTRWLWDRHHAGTPQARRWHAQDTRDIRPAFTALRDGRLQSALDECGVLADSRDALGLRTTDPVTLFGLGGMGQSRKPKVALDLTPAGPILRLHYSGGSAVLSRSLWTIPPDLEAHLRGWPPPRVPQR